MTSEYLATHKVTLLLTTVIVFLLGVILFLVLEKPDKVYILPKESTSTSTPVAEVQKQTHTYLENKALEGALQEYLSDQETLVWKTKNESHVFCSVENLIPDNELFPLSVWAYCTEYELENNTLKKLSGSSGPVKVDYPNELSYYDLSSFSHQVPRDGSLYSVDIQKIFPLEVQERIATFDVKDISERNETVALEKIKKWQDIQNAIRTCKVDTIFQTHNREVTAQFKDGSEIRTTEPNIDDVLQLAVEAEGTCGPILMTTE